MRKFLFPLLLASAAATPAAVAASPHNDAAGREARAERREAISQARAERQEARSERQEARSERRERNVEFRASGGERRVRAEATGNAGGADVETIRQVRERGSGSNDSVRNWRQSERQQIRERRQRIEGQSGEFRQSQRAAPRVFRDRVPVVSRTPREGTQPPLRAESRRTSPTRWSTHWRKDRRYDWSNWRNRHRTLFRLGFYSDPFGWNYRPYSIGWRMWPSYYSSRFWISDPWQYRLPYAPPGYRWIRYYDDAILIDTWSGQVVDVIHHFFW